jgi:quercetin dioxygenase-like cupin family protein
MNIIRNSRAAGNDSIHMTSSQFTGDVWADPILMTPEQGITIASVMFTPCARTHWHIHELGQLLTVTAGSGLICDKGGEPQKLNVGDIVWCPAGTTHWHGAAVGSYMVHIAATHGKMTWLDPVTDEDYMKAQ